jgi:hypothetical protein
MEAVRRSSPWHRPPCSGRRGPSASRSPPARYAGAEDSPGAGSDTPPSPGARTGNTHTGFTTHSTQRNHNTYTIQTRHTRYTTHRTRYTILKQHTHHAQCTLQHAIHNIQQTVHNI